MTWPTRSSPPRRDTRRRLTGATDAGLWVPVLVLVILACTCLAPRIGRAMESEGVGLALTYRTYEYTPSAEFVTQWDHSRLDISIGATVLARDPKNHEKVNVSLSGLYTFAALALGGLAHPEDVGAESSESIGWVTVGAAALANSKFHPFRVLMVPSSSRRLVELSPYLQTRTEHYTAGKTDWARYSPGLGLELLELGPPDSRTRSRHGFALRAGAECPFDLISLERSGWTNWQFSVGVLWVGITPSSAGPGAPPR